MGREHYEMRFGGSGGQGMMLMGDVLAQSAGISEGREVVLLKSYGPEARGGACRSELIIDSGSINYPALTKPDFVLAMSQLACDSYTDDMDKENGALLVDEELVKNVPSDVCPGGSSRCRRVPKSAAVSAASAPGGLCAVNPSRRQESLNRKLRFSTKRSFRFAARFQVDFKG